MKGFKYKDAKGENGPVKVAQLKKSGGGVFQIKAAAKTVGGPLGIITVVPPNPGTDGCVRLEIGGGGDAYDVRFADGQVTNDGAKQFKVLNPVTEGTCPPPPPPCNSAAFPTCGGTCPAGQTCYPLHVDGSLDLCLCAATGAPCPDTVTACGFNAFACPPGQACHLQEGLTDILAAACGGCSPSRGVPRRIVLRVTSGAGKP